MLKEQDTKTERFAHIRRTRIIGAIGAAVAIIGGLGLAAPQQASAMTLAELDVKLEEVSSDLAAKEEALQTAQDNLSAHLARVYKSGKQPSVIDAIVSSDGLGDLIDNLQYNDALTQSYQQAVEKAQEARDAVDATKREYEDLQTRKREQRKSLSEMGSIWYYQGDYSYPYWGGTVASHGCGACARAFIVSSLTGQDVDLKAFIEDDGDWLGMDKSCTDHSGTGDLSHAEWMKQRYDIEMSDVTDRCQTTDGLRDTLDVEEGMVMIVSSGSNLYHNKSRTATRGTGGHYVTIYAAADDGGFYIHDSSWPDGEGAGVYYTEAEMQNLLDHTSRMVLFQN